MNYLSFANCDDRGQYYFVGNYYFNSSMFQTVNLIAYVNDSDQGNVFFNLSACLDRYYKQDDSASQTIEN